MVGHYERRWSWAAKWCERVAYLCIPYFGLAIVLHRFGKIGSVEAVWLVAFGILMIAASLLLGVKALFDLWYGGLRGGKATVRGVALSLVMLSPFIWFGYLAVEHPLLNDVSTSPYEPPAYPTAELVRRNEGANELAAYDTEYGDGLIAAYPKLGSRRYNAGPERVAIAVRALVEDRGWKVTAEQSAPPEGADPAASDAPATISIEAVAETLIFGFKSDVVVEVVPEAEATLVDMRSASRFGSHDFGWNAQLIEDFLADLDAALLGISGEG